MEMPSFRVLLAVLLALLVAGARAAFRCNETVFDFTPQLKPLIGKAGTTDLFPMGKCHGFKLEEATIDEMQDAMNKSKISSVQLVSCYMTRYYQTQPYINSVMQINPDALAIAAQLDNERAAGKWRGPLHGIPFTVKDNIGTLDNLETTAGSWALLGSIVPRDAYVVKRLREAGAVLFGKAAMSEWADMRSSNYSEGYSARGGQCRSAYNLTVNPGGSSSGSGVGVAANVIAFSIGTETDGSVINPAMRNSIVGFKPTVGLTSRAGVIPESEHQDSVGTFGRTVKDAVYAFNATYGVDPHDNYTTSQEGRTPTGGYLQFIANQSALNGAKFGIPWKSFWVHANAEQQRVLLELVTLIESANATVFNGTEIKNYDTIVSRGGWDWDLGTKRGYPNESEYTYVKVDFFINFSKYLQQLNNTNIKTLKQVVDYNAEYAGSEGGYPFPHGHPAFYSGQDGFLDSLQVEDARNDTYFQALWFCQNSTREGINSALYNNGEKLNGLLVPVDPGQSYQIAAQAGYPMITLPVGTSADSGMGIGLGIMQTEWGEDELIKYGSAIEDLQFNSSPPFERPLPTWRGYLARNLPVPL